MYQDGITFQVHIDGKAAFEYPHEGRRYIEGRKGSAFDLYLLNSTSTRRKVVFSVDGQNILTGDDVWERGYVVDPYKSISVPGWSIDETNVARFRFFDEQHSYNRNNVDGVADSHNIGAIGAMIFDEKLKPVTHWDNCIQSTLETKAPLWNDSSVLPVNYQNTIQDTIYAKGVKGGGDYYDRNIDKGIGLAAMGNYTMNLAAQCSVEPRCGTAWGETTEFRTREVYYDFEKVARLEMSFVYDYRRGLIRRGINMHDYTVPRQEPSAFPSRKGCPPPRKRY